MTPVLRELLEGWRPGNLPQVTRSGATYQQVINRTQRQLTDLVMEYHNQESYDQTTQMIREEIDETLRRYHKYCIRDHVGAHYRESDLPRNHPVEFEHVIPIRVVRESLLAGRLTREQALNVPTCYLSREKHTKLNQIGMQYSTPCSYWFWQRYQKLDIKIQTRNGDSVDLGSWNLDDHFRYFESL
jgi:hypothetical protein